MEAEDWDDLADSELRVKLEQAGVDPEIAARLVKLRDDPDFRGDLAEFMDAI